jgi:transcriptional regulator with XRE-family HTH domain
MSYLSIALQRQTERRQFNQSDLARASGLSKSYISRLFNGESHELSDENFVALVKIFSADPHAQAELIAARCRDTLAGAAGTPGADLVEIKVKAEPGKHHASSEDPGPQVQLAQETERAFAWLRNRCPLNPDLEQHLIGYARLMGMK